MSLNQWSIRITLTLQLKHFVRLFWKTCQYIVEQFVFEDALNN